MSDGPGGVYGKGALVSFGTPTQGLGARGGVRDRPWSQAQHGPDATAGGEALDPIQHLSLVVLAGSSVNRRAVSAVIWTGEKFKRKEQ
jgi:hypothetical protein